jgi:multiple sugar transport system ATP-binding protein
MLAGLEEVDAGSVLIGGRDVTDLAPKKRDVAMVFQNYALYPYLTVSQNIGFPLKIAKVARKERERRVFEVAKLLGLEEYLHRKPGQLSGGQRQRVAMGRAIIRLPSVFCMDEPLSNLDAKLRVQMRADIAALQADFGVTTVYVTHDQSEAMTIGHRVAAMRDGRLQQVGPPRELYDRPVNTFVAGFIGSPAMNLADAELVDANGRIAVRFGPHTLPIDEDVVWARPALREYVGRRLALGVRPEDLEDASLVPTSPADRRLRVRVDIKEDMGAEVYLHFASEAPTVQTEELREIVGDEALEAAEEQTHHHGGAWTARVDRRTLAREGDELELAVSTGNLHFFDLETGAGIYGGDRAPAAVG